MLPAVIFWKKANSHFSEKQLLSTAHQELVHTPPAAANVATMKIDALHARAHASYITATWEQRSCLSVQCVNAYSEDGALVLRQDAHGKSGSRVNLRLRNTNSWVVVILDAGCTTWVEKKISAAQHKTKRNRAERELQMGRWKINWEACNKHACKHQKIEIEISWSRAENQRQYKFALRYFN